MYPEMDNEVRLELEAGCARLAGLTNHHKDYGWYVPEVGGHIGWFTRSREAMAFVEDWIIKAGNMQVYRKQLITIIQDDWERKMREEGRDRPTPTDETCWDLAIIAPAEVRARAAYFFIGTANLLKVLFPDGLPDHLKSGDNGQATDT